MVQQNFMNDINFRFVVDRLPYIEYFVQAANLPGININERVQPTAFKPMYHHGDTITYGELNLTVKADVLLKSYRDTMEWIVGLSFPDNFPQFKNLKDSDEGLYSDLSLIILNNRQNPIFNIRFKDAFPLSLGELQIDTTQPDVDTPAFDVTFKHNGFEFLDEL